VFTHLALHPVFANGVQPGSHEPTASSTAQLLASVLFAGNSLAAVPGFLAYGDTQEKAAQLARALAFRVLADQIEAGELAVNSVSFAA